MANRSHPTSFPRPNWFMCERVAEEGRGECCCTRRITSHHSVRHTLVVDAPVLSGFSEDDADDVQNRGEKWFR